MIENILNFRISAQTYDKTGVLDPGQINSCDNHAMRIWIPDHYQLFPCHIEYRILQACPKVWGILVGGQFFFLSVCNEMDRDLYAIPKAEKFQCGTMRIRIRIQNTGQNIISTDGFLRYLDKRTFFSRNSADISNGFLSFLHAFWKIFKSLVFDHFYLIGQVRYRPAQFILIIFPLLFNTVIFATSTKRWGTAPVLICLIWFAVR